MIWLIHGTFSDPDTWEDDFVDYVETLFDEKSEKLRWSGENKKGARSDYAEAMLKRIMEWHKENPNDPIRLVGHSQIIIYAGYFEWPVYATNKQNIRGS